MKKLKTGFDNYCLHPRGLLPFELVKWGMMNGAEGVAFSGFNDSVRDQFTTSYLHDVRQLAADNDMYLEWGNGQHVPMDLTSFTPKDIFTVNRKAVGEAYALGTNIIRSCSGGLMRWKKDSPSTEHLLKESASSLKKQATLFRDYGMTLAIETHFEFTTFELLRLFEMCEVSPGDWLGICLDTMNLLAMIEEPVEATHRVLPWIVSTHIKDGGILTNEEGMITFPAPLGDGIIDIAAIIGMVSGLERDINLSVECHGGSFSLPVNETWFIERFPDLPVLEYDQLLELSESTGVKMNTEGLKITPRESWQDICETRTKSDIKKLRIIRDRLQID
ncbi:MAG: TIM barrel protein [Bacteroidales bacterium]